MTFKEKYMTDNPVTPSEYHNTCPKHCGYEDKIPDDHCAITTCEECWNREMSGATISDAEKWAEDIRRRYQELRNVGFSSNDALILVTAYLKGGNHNG